MTTYTQSLRLWQGTPFDPAIRAAWGPPLNTNDTLIDNAINLQAPIDLTGLTTYTLTTSNGAPDQARCAVLNLINTPAAACTVILPNVPRVGWAINNTLGGQTITLQAGSGTTVALPADGTYHLYVADGAGNIALQTVAVTPPSPGLVGTSLTINGASQLNGPVTILGTLNANGIAAQGNLSAFGISTPGAITAQQNITSATGLVAGASITVGGAGKATFGFGTPLNLSNVTIDPSSTAAIFVNTRTGNVTPFTGYVCNLGVTGSFHAIWQFNGAIAGSITPVGGSGTAYNTTSDATLKNDMGIIEGVGDLIDKLRPRWFTWKSNPDATPEPGFFAQEVSRVWKWAVTKGRGRKGRKAYVPWMMDNAKLIPLLVAEIQDLRRRMLELERRP